LIIKTWDLTLGTGLSFHWPKDFANCTPTAGKMVFLVNRTSMVNFQVKSDETLKNFKSMRQSFLWTNGLMRGGGAQDLRKQQIYIINQCLDLLHTGIKSAVKPDTFMSEEV
jgi:hypothetical protein